jgi:hypothetical protein
MVKYYECSICTLKTYNKSLFSRKGSVNKKNLQKFIDFFNNKTIKLGDCCNSCYLKIFPIKKKVKNISNENKNIETEILEKKNDVNGDNNTKKKKMKKKFQKKKVNIIDNKKVLNNNINTNNEFINNENNEKIKNNENENNEKEILNNNKNNENKNMKKKMN